MAEPPAIDAVETAPRVVIADDHDLVRSGLRMILETGGFDIVGEASSGEEAVQMARRLQPDLVMLDVSMRGISGIDATPQVLAAAPRCRVLLVTAHRESSYLQRGFAAGATGFVPKDSAPAELIAAARAVAAGGEYVHPVMGAQLAKEPPMFDRTLRGPGGELTDRELEVLREVALGRTNQESAERLNLSIRTVENHRAHIMQKLAVGSRAELVRLAFAAGLIGPTE